MSKKEILLNPKEIDSVTLNSHSYEREFLVCKVLSDKISSKIENLLDKTTDTQLRGFLEQLVFAREVVFDQESEFECRGYMKLHEYLNEYIFNASNSFMEIEEPSYRSIEEDGNTLYVEIYQKLPTRNLSAISCTKELKKIFHFRRYLETLGYIFSKIVDSKKNIEMYSIVLKDNKPFINVDLSNIDFSLFEKAFNVNNIQESIYDNVEHYYEEIKSLEFQLNDLFRVGVSEASYLLRNILKNLKIKFKDISIYNYKLYIKEKTEKVKREVTHRLAMWQLQMRQQLSLKQKIRLSMSRIREWYYKHDGHVYVSYSGGIDSTVLASLVRSEFPDVPLVFIDTGLEYPKIRSFALAQENVIVIKPSMNFRQVLKQYGIPVISKSQAMAIRKLRTQNLSPEYRNKLLYGDERGSAGRLSDKWHYLLNAPFKISEECCMVMKKTPISLFEKESGRVGFIGTLSDESFNRENTYLQYGCNAFDSNKPKSTPLGFWTKQDILQYIKEFNVPYSEEYGDIIEVNGKLTTTDEKRTGCIFCLFGCHIKDGELNRLQRMKLKYPKLHDYCINNLGLGEVLDYINVPYDIPENYHTSGVSVSDANTEKNVIQRKPLVENIKGSEINLVAKKNGQLSFGF